ncbi:MAG: DUF6263 family protein [Planctomycetota bacterium]|jgi:hypothetical protein
MKFAWSIVFACVFSITALACTGADEPARKGVAVLAAGSGKKFKLKQKFPPGRNYTITISRSLEQTVKDTRESVRQETFLTAQVEKLENGGRKLKLTFDRLTLKHGVAGVTKMNVDTAAKTAPSSDAEIALACIPGNSLSIVLSPDGEVSGTEGKNAFIEGMLTKMEELMGGLSTQERENTKKFLGETISFEELAGEITENLEILPGTSLAVGARWKQSCSMNFPETGKVITGSVTEFAEVRGDKAILKRSFNLGKPLTIEHPVPMILDFLNGNSIIEFDTGQGELKKVAGNIEMKMTSKVRNQKEPVTIKRHMKRAITYAIKECKSPAPDKEDKAGKAE